MPREVKIITLVSLALLASTPVLASEQAEAVERGELLYRVHCRSCHGAEATGAGPMAELLKIQPTDLTRIAERSGNEFRQDVVYTKIDGREDIRGHGSREMPVWGLSFQSVGLDSSQEADVRLRIRDLVAYLESIQSDPAEADHSER